MSVVRLPLRPGFLLREKRIIEERRISERKKKERYRDQKKIIQREWAELLLTILDESLLQVYLL